MTLTNADILDILDQSMAIARGFTTLRCNKYLAYDLDEAYPELLGEEIHAYLSEAYEKSTLYWCS